MAIFATVAAMVYGPICGLSRIFRPAHAAMEVYMRKTAITCVLAVLFTRPALAQEWTEYKSVQDGFQALFVGQPRVVETTWKSQAGFKLPARVYSIERVRERYSVTVADYSGIQAFWKERV